MGARPSFSPTPAATTWMMEMKEVSPAMVKEAKKSTPNRAPPGICEMTVGKVTKDSSGPVMFFSSSTPTPWAPAMKPRVAKTPMPASSSKAELAKPATSPVPTRLERRRRR